MTERYRRNGKQVIVDDRHYCDALDEAAAADIVRTMNLADELQLFNPDITRPLPPPGSIAAWNRDNEALEDFRTHRRGWRELLVRARDEAKTSVTEDSDDHAYWEHELRAFDRIAAVATNRHSEAVARPLELPSAVDQVQTREENWIYHDVPHWGDNIDWKTARSHGARGKHGPAPAGGDMRGLSRTDPI